MKMKLKLLATLLASAGLLATAGPAAAGAARGGGAALDSCCTAGDQDFPKVGGNLGNQNYSSLRAVNRTNIRQLGAVWLNRIEGGLNTGTNQSTPVVVDGVIYIESALANVIAVDGRTGATQWKWTAPEGSTRRGVAVAKDLGLVYTLSQQSLVALDISTGAERWRKAYPTTLGNVQKVALVYHGQRLFIGTNDGNRGAALSVNATNGELLTSFFGVPGPGELGYDTWGGATEANRTGATPWLHPAVDPELGLVYWTFGNVRGGSSQNGSARPGQNLFSNSIVALDLKTGAYKWHFQSIHHDIWDMDNVMSPVLADVSIDGVPRKIVAYGSKSGMVFLLDRLDGSAVLGIDERPVPQDARQATWPTQPFPRQGGYTEQCAISEPLGGPVPGHPSRAVPNYPTGCLYTPHWDVPMLTFPGHGGAADWNHQSFSQSTKLLYTGMGYVGAAHSLTESSNGLRPPGEYQTGAVVAIDPTTNTVRWKKRMPYSLAHGNGILTTASDLLFIGQPDGNFLAMDAANGRELWRFQTGAAISASPISYEIDGQQYVAIYAGGTGIPYGNSAPRGDYLWAFKVGGTLPPAATPTPPVVRRPVSGSPVAGSVVNNTVTLARIPTAANQPGATESTAVNAMTPTHMQVAVGTTVTFSNPAGNVNAHCATQFFEGLFNFRLLPGQSATYTFTRPGEYFFNDCFSPRPTGKIEVLP